MYVERKDTAVVLQFDLPVPTWEKRRFPMLFSCGDTVYAGLLADKMREELGDFMASVREQAYNDGFADAKAKRGKRQGHSRCA